MLADWYFCSAIRLSPKATHTFLDICTALRRRDEQDAALVLLALEQLRQAELSQLLYLTADIIAAAETFATNPIILRAANALLAELERAAEREMAVLFVDGSTAARPSVRERLAQLAAVVNLRDTSELSKSDRPYLDTIEFCPEVVALSYLANLSDGEPAVAEVVEEHQTLALLLRRALEGSYGRLAFLLACRILRPATPEVVRSALADARVGIPWLEPDLMAAIAAAYFAEPAPLEHLAAEAGSHSVLSSLLQTSQAADERRLAEVRIVLGIEGGRVEWQAEQLWQVTLAALAVSSPDPGWIYDWLDAPPASGQSRTPWINRRDERVETRRPQNHADALSKSKFRGCEESVRFVCLLATVQIAAAVAGPVVHRSEGRRAALKFVLHAADVLADVRHRDLVRDLAKGQQYPDGASLSQPVAALAAHSRVLTERVGGCRERWLDPNDVVQLMIEESEQSIGDTESGKLFETAAPMVVSQWIFEATSGITALKTVDPSAKWFAVAKDRFTSPAQEAVSWIVTLLLGRAAAGSGNHWRSLLPQPQLLMKQIWQTETEVLANWPARLKDRNPSIGAPEFLLNDTLSEDEWRELSERAERFANRYGGPLAMATERLAAVLPVPASLMFDSWFASWSAMMDAVHTPTHLRREIRRRLVRLFDQPAATLESQEALRPVFEKVIDLIVEFSVSAPSDLFALSDALTTPHSLDGAFLQVLRARFLQSAGLPPASITDEQAMSSPMAVQASRRNAVIRQATMRRFVHSVGSARVETAGAGELTLGSLYCGLWDAGKKAAADSPRRSVWTPTGGAPPDERWISSAVLDNAERRIDFRLLDRELPAGVKNTTDLAILQSDIRRRTLANMTGDLSTLGIVAAVDHAPGAPTSTVWVNCGLEDPVGVPTTTHCVIGDPVRFRLLTGTGEAAYAGQGLEMLERADPLPGEVRDAVLKARDGSPDQPELLSVEISGTTGEPGPKPNDAGDRARWIHRWDPDAAASYRASPEIHTAACWNAGDRCWYPVDRTMTELVALLSASGRSEEEALAWITVVQVVESEGVDGWRISTAPGMSYLIEADDWSHEDLAQLEAERRSGGVEGLRVLIGLVDHEGHVRIEFRDTSRIDRTNREWADLADDDDQPLVAEEVGAGQWRMPHEVDGFPRSWVRVDGMSGRHGRTVFIAKSWSHLDQRQGTVQATPVDVHKLVSPENPEEDHRFDRVEQLARHDVVELEYMLGSAPRNGIWRARTTDGLVVTVEPESITMAPIKGHQEARLGRRRKAVVYDIVPRRRTTRRALPMRTDDLFPLASEELKQSLLGLDEIRGTCAERPAKSGQSGDMYTLWLSIGGKATVCRVRDSAFTVLPGAVGDPVIVSRHGDGSWTLEAKLRTVMVRALWKASRRPAAARGTARTFLCQLDTGSEVFDVGQELTRPEIARPELIFTTADGLQRAHLDALTRGGRLHIPTDVDVSVRDSRVELITRDGAALHGLSSGTQRNAAHRVSSVHAWLESVDACDDQEWWVVRRRLTLQPVVRAFRSNVDQYRQDWNAYLGGENRHLLGSRRGSDVRLAGLNVPQLDGSWSDVVPLVPDQETWVSSRHYSREDIRVTLVEKDAVWSASFAEAVPLTLEEFLEHLRLRGMAVQARPSNLLIELRYAGRSEGTKPMHRFEWGYGWTIQLPPERLELVGRPLTGDLPMFYGDTVRRAGFPQRTQGPVMDLDRISIDMDVGHQLFVDASEYRIVHRLEVDVMLATGKVQVRVVHGRRERFNDGDIDDSVALQVSNGELDEDTVKAILAEEGAALGDGDPHETRRLVLLGSLDCKKFEESTGRTLSFRRVTDLKKSQRVFMVAGDIVEGRNELLLELHLPPNLSGWAGRRPTVRVKRRAFAAREGLLRRLHHTGASLRGTTMLVDLLETPEGGQSWQGSTRTSLSRPFNFLLDYVQHHAGRCYAVLSRVSPQGVGLEFRPGVYFWVPSSKVVREGPMTKGSIVRIASDGDGCVTVYCAVLDDHTYVSAEGRPALVLPKEPLLRDKVAVSTASDPNMFTVAGLPDIQATFGGADAVAFMRTAHPKIALVRSTGGKVTVTDPGGVISGSIDVDRVRAMPRIRPTHGGPGSEQWTTWSQLSFADAGGWEIAAALEHSGWLCHDRRTGHWPVVSKEGFARFTPKPLEVRDTISPSRGPVFFAAGPVLRYPQSELRRFGFPAGEVVSGMSDEIGREPTEFVVAGAVQEASGGLWIETFPGRVIELSADLLVAGPGDRYRSLRDLDWSRFARGDRVKLALHQPDGDLTQVACVALHSWSPGPRAAFTGTRTLVRIIKSEVAEMKLVLGAGKVRLSYPVTPSQLHKSTDPAFGWLHADNTFELWRQDDRPARDDTVLLGRDDQGGLTITGLPGWQVDLSGDDVCWSGSEWIRTALHDPDEAALLLRMVGGQLPVTIDQVVDQRVLVSRRLQPAGSVRPGLWVRCQVLGMLNSTTVLLAAGASLLRVAAAKVVPGLPEAVSGTAMLVLSRDPQPKWFHADGKGELAGGLPREGRVLQGRLSEIQVKAVRVIDDQAGNLGVLCRQIDSAAYRWLPAAEVGWVSDLAADELTKVVNQRKNAMSGVVLDDGSISIVAARGGAARYAALRPGSCFRVTVDFERSNRPSGPKRYIGTVYQHDILIEFESAEAGRSTAGAPIMAEVTSVESPPRRHLLTVEEGRRRVRLDLPPKVVAALRRPGAAIDRGFWLEPVDEHLVDLVMRSSLEGGIQVLRDWLHERGQVALAFEEGCLDTATLLAAAVLAAEVEVPTEVAMADLRRLSVWLTWQAGARAARSRHVETLLMEWIRSPELLDIGEWRRLQQVANGIAEEISLPAVREIAAASRGIIGRSRVRDDAGLTAIARALLDAVGECDDGPVADAGVPTRLADLSALGRALVPPVGAVTSQPCLLDGQIGLVRAAFTEFVAEGVWLPLQPPAWVFSTEERRAHGRDLLKASLDALTE